MNKRRRHKAKRRRRLKRHAARAARVAPPVVEQSSQHIEIRRRIGAPNVIEEMIRGQQRFVRVLREMAAGYHAIDMRPMILHGGQVTRVGDDPVPATLRRELADATARLTELYYELGYAIACFAPEEPREEETRDEAYARAFYQVMKRMAAALIELKPRPAPSRWPVEPIDGTNESGG